MRCLRAKLVEEIVVDYSYGWAAHPVNNLVKDLVKKVEPFQTFLQQAMSLAEAVKYRGFLSKIFSVISKRSLGVALVMVLLSPSR